MFLDLKNAEEVYNITYNITLRYTNVVDLLSTIIIKHGTNAITHPLANITNLSLEQGIFPKKLKFSMVKPLHKKKSKDRSLQLSSSNFSDNSAQNTKKTYSDYLRKIIFFLLDKYNNIQKNQQRGFRRKNSTMLVIYKLMSKILSQLFKYFIEPRLLHYSET